MKNPVISIIAPIYGVEKYIAAAAPTPYAPEPRYTLFKYISKILSLEIDLSIC